MVDSLAKRRRGAHHGEAPRGSARFDSLEYQCHDYSSDDWCWEARSVELAVTPAL